jgi:hypothetical protein
MTRHFYHSRNVISLRKFAGLSIVLFGIAVTYVVIASSQYSYVRSVNQFSWWAAGSLWPAAGATILFGLAKIFERSTSVRNVLYVLSLIATYCFAGMLLISIFSN